MNARERLWAALNHQIPDRVPIWMLYPRERLGYYVDVHTLPSYTPLMDTIWHQTDWFDRRSIPAPPFYTSAANIETHTKTAKGWTITRKLLHTPLGDLISEHRQDADNAAGATTEHYCKSVDDLEKILAISYVPAEPDMRTFHQAARKLGNDGLMMVNLGMPISMAYNLTHPETFAIWTLTAPQALIDFTSTMFERMYTFLKKALAAGAGPVFFTVGTEFVAPPMCSPQAFDTLITPFDGPLFDLIHHYDGKVIVHHHGNVRSLLRRIAQLGADGIQPIEEPPIGDCTLAEAKQHIGEQICIIGSVQYDDFARLSPEEMEQLVRRQISDAAPGGGMILAPTAGPYAAHLSKRQQENILCFIESGIKWGQYPL